MRARGRAAVENLNAELSYGARIFGFPGVGTRCDAATGPSVKGLWGGERFGFGLESWKWQQVGARAWPPFPKSNDRMRSYSFCYIARFAGLQENCSDGGVRQRGNVALWRPARPFVNIEFW